MGHPESTRAAVDGCTRSELPLVSVVIPVYNAAPFLRQSLDSVLDQGYPSLEVIAVDDGSTDESARILASYGDRIRVLRQQRRGTAAARNLGVRASGGALIAFQDSDDVWLGGKLDEQVRYLLDHDDVGIVFGQFVCWFPEEDGSYSDPESATQNPETWEIKQPLTGYIYADELLGSYIAMNLPVIRRTVYEAVGGFDESLEAGSDYDFWLKATYRFKAHKLEKSLALYRIHKQGITGTPRPTNYSFVVLKRALDTTGLRGPDGREADRVAVERRLAETWLHFGTRHMERGDRKVGAKAMLRYLRMSAFRPKALLDCASVFARSLKGTK